MVNNKYMVHVNSTEINSPGLNLKKWSYRMYFSVEIINLYTCSVNECTFIFKLKRKSTNNDFLMIHKCSLSGATLKKSPWIQYKVRHTKSEPRETGGQEVLRPEIHLYKYTVNSWCLPVHKYSTMESFWSTTASIYRNL